jgi:hypothetical protein
MNRQRLVLPITHRTTRSLEAADDKRSGPAKPDVHLAEATTGRALWPPFRRGRTVDGADTTIPAAASRDLSQTGRVAEQLAEHCDDAVILLHHRATPRVKPNIDHLAICPSGVWVIDTRRNKGRVATRKPMFGDAKLTIGGRERTDLLLNLERQVEYVRQALAKTAPGVPVRSALCFVDTEAPLLRTLYLGAYLFFGTPAVAKHLNSEGPLGTEQIKAIATVLEARFPPA